MKAAGYALVGIGGALIGDAGGQAVAGLFVVLLGFYLTVTRARRER